jgi:hypothetical protein
MASTIERIDPQQAYDHMHADANALLVCAYDSEDKFQQNRLEGAIALEDFRSQADAIPQDEEIIFYCA